MLNHPFLGRAFAENKISQKCQKEAIAWNNFLNDQTDTNLGPALEYIACMNKEYGNLPEPPPWSSYAARGEKALDQQHLIGKTYKEAREEILSSSWKIYDSKPSEADIKNLKGRSDTNYKELEACTGGGASYCSFIFKDDQGKRLRIVVKGEKEPDFRVLYANILPEDYK